MGALAVEEQAQYIPLPQLFAAIALAKRAARSTDSLYVPIPIDGWEYVQSCSCWTYKSQMVFEDGTRTRRDSVWVLSGDLSNLGSSMNARFKLVHRVRNQRAPHLDMAITTMVSVNGLELGAEGSVQGSYDDDSISSGSFALVKRHLIVQGTPAVSWGDSGWVEVERNGATYRLQFDGSSTPCVTAQAPGGPTQQFRVDVTTGKEHAQKQL
jgi:hypothetical protein